jgi:hypothetical protein
MGDFENREKIMTLAGCKKDRWLRGFIQPPIESEPLDDALSRTRGSSDGENRPPGSAQTAFSRVSTSGSCSAYTACVA